MTDAERLEAPTRTSRGRFVHGLWRLTQLGGVAYLALAILVACVQRSLIYGPSRVASVDPPDGLGSRSLEPVEFTTVDGVSLHGWRLSPPERDGAAADPDVTVQATHGRSTVLFFCGNAGCRGDRDAEFELLNELGADVFCFDYRGYGDNAGSPSEEHLLRDARGAWRYLTRDRGIPGSQIVLFGESLGGGVATRLAADVCRGGEPPAGLVLRSTFSSLEDAAAGLYWWLPVRWLLWDRYRSIDHIGAVNCPLLMFHGDRDDIVPLDLGRRLFQAAADVSSTEAPKQWIVLPDVGHNDYFWPSRDRMKEVLGEFVRTIAAENRP